jgi:hypothetical protein
MPRMNAKTTEASIPMMMPTHHGRPKLRMEMA